MVAALVQCWVLFLSLAMAPAKSVRSAAGLNAEAMHLASQRKLTDALSMFCEASRLDPSNADFLNNVGVVQMRCVRSELYPSPPLVGREWAHC